MNAAARNGLSFEQCLAVSLAAHVLFFLLMKGLPSFSIAPPIEVEITSPFLGTGPAKLAAPKALVPGAKGIPMPPAPRESPVAPKVDEPQREWVAPTPGVTKTIKPQENAPNPTGADNVPKDATPPTPGGAPGGIGIAPGLGGEGAGHPFGVPGGIGDGGAALDELPRLLNGAEVRKNINRFYPKNEQRAGNQGFVQLAVHIGIDGSVGDVEILHADSPAFGEAAGKVAKLMRFSPAMKANRAVPTRFRLPPIQFILKD